MDRIIEKKKWLSRKIVFIASVIGILMLFISGYYFASGKSKLNVDSGRLIISEVKKGNFREFIPVNGIVLPLTTIYLDAIEGGRVEEIYVEDGSMVRKGQKILSLINTDLELSLSNQETSVFNLLTQMQISRNAAQQNTIMKLNQSSEVENGLIEAERVYKVDKKLFGEGVIALQDYKKSENNYHYYLQKRQLTEKILSQDSLSTDQEMKQAKESYLRTQKSLQIMRRKVEDLIVKAPIDGQLTSFDAHIGQNRNKGERLGQVDAKDGFRVRANIEEHYISRIFTGLQGEFTISGETYTVEIKKVYTQVSNGQFQVDMHFTGKVPQFRRGQSLQIRLALSEEAKALIIPRGGFFQTSGGNWIYKISGNGDQAYKTAIRLGRQNPDYYEVQEGLQEGDKVITSGYEGFGEKDELIID